MFSIHKSYNNQDYKWYVTGRSICFLSVSKNGFLVIRADWRIVFFSRMYMLIFANRIIVSYVCGIDVVFQFVDWFAAHVVFVNRFSK